MKNFEELIVWQKAIELAKQVYLTTRSYPKEEIFGLVSQLRRSSVSVSSNIAEGFGRKSLKDKERFYLIALGSLLEVKSQLYVSIEVELVTRKDIEKVFILVEDIHRMINALAKSVRGDS